MRQMPLDFFPLEPGWLRPSGVDEDDERLIKPLNIVVVDGIRC